MRAPKQYPRSSNFLIQEEKRGQDFLKGDQAVQPITFDLSPQYTGRYFAIFKGDINKNALSLNALQKNSNLKIVSSSEIAPDSRTSENLNDAEVLYYEDMGIALFGSEDDEKLNYLTTRNSTDYIFVPELFRSTPEIIHGSKSTSGNSFTWGLESTKSHLSPYTGLGVKVAILDTGFDHTHPDFVGRKIVGMGFTDSGPKDMMDTEGHGTHCIGTACGLRDSSGKRYGVAYESQIYYGKIFNRNGTVDQWIFDAMEWSWKNGCRVISMSLGGNIPPCRSFDPAFEAVGKAALRNGALVIAAAGNASNRSSGYVATINSPADCNSFMAIAALDQQHKVADFSCGAILPGVSIDVAAPGVNIYSSVPMPQRYDTYNGTSMATPHVAGIAALLFEKSPHATPEKIAEEIRTLALTIPHLHQKDGGNGLAQAPGQNA